jgi:hypothetical protein
MEPTARPFGANQVFRDLMAQWLKEGIERGDLRPDLDIPAVVDMLLGLYAWNYRLAPSENADAERLTQVMDQQIGMVFEGLRPQG